MVLAVGNDRETWCDLPFTPDAQNAGMCEVDASPAVKPVEAFDDIIGIAGARCAPFVGGVPCAFAPSDERRHGPQPRVLGALERPDVRITTDRNTIRDGKPWRAMGMGGIPVFEFMASGHTM